ncbi:MAG: nei [Ilumatobacteraceae bacterium]|nr:nei [Ilumatobacteraceae bacterium]
MRSFRASRLVGPIPAIGRTIETVTSHGKHLEFVWDDGITLHTYLRLSGAWHLYRHDERWRKSDDQMRVSLEVEDWVAVCFSAPIVETFRQFDRHRHPGFGRTGPDLCRRDANLDECVVAILDYRDPAAPVAEVLLDQQVANGIGNVFRSEVLWDVQLSPYALVGAIDVTDARAMVESAARLLRAHLNDGRQSTAVGAGSGMAVYGRNGQPCPRCSDTIQVKRFGAMNRLLYWCATCQARGDARIAPTPPAGMERPMDPHPAAAMYLSDLPWKRHAEDHEPHADTA